MFNVTRPDPGPDCSKDCRSKEVITALKSMFYGKCYLCENDVSDPVVEHFIPHEGDVTKEYDWNNLYYSCHRCNSIKGTTKELLDCCDPSIDVLHAIKCLCPSVSNNNIIVEPQDDSAKTKNTACLLDKCYNENNTGIREISREELHDKLFDKYCVFINYRRTMKNKDSLAAEKDNAKEHLKNMMEASYPFSVFWYWHIISDPLLNSIF
ncbi:MAG: hypothetical protein LBU51_09165 [Bacteroidales bacterium]|jgi:uncharacterized protein (TIGR02646 family)|nr:hypothetical protein [Bacteroidales bacterium]